MLQSPEQLCRRLVSWGFLGVSVCFFVLHVFFQCLLVCSCCQIFIGQIGKIKFSCCKILANTPHVNQPLQSRLSYIGQQQKGVSSNIEKIFSVQIFSFPGFPHQCSFQQDSMLFSISAIQFSLSSSHGTNISRVPNCPNITIKLFFGSGCLFVFLFFVQTLL